MIVINEDIWKFHPQDYIVIPTNGSINQDGENVMGRGLALQAKTKFPILPFKLGTMLTMYGNWPFLWYGAALITFPTKTSWRARATLENIERSCSALQIELSKEGNNELTFVMPKVGCGNGELDWKDVEPIIEKYFPDITIVDNERGRN